MDRDVARQMRGLIAEVRAILLESWDPLRVGDQPDLADEYDGVLGQVIAAVGQAGGWRDIAATLSRLEREYGLGGASEAANAPTARRLLELRGRAPRWPTTGFS